MQVGVDRKQNGELARTFKLLFNVFLSIFSPPTKTVITFYCHLKVIGKREGGSIFLALTCILVT